MKKVRKIVISVVCCVLVAALIVGGIVFWRSKNAKSVEVYPVSNLTSSYWGDSTQLTGNVSTGKVQNVPLKDSLIESVNVSEGDTVHVGDVLMVYDTPLISSLSSLTDPALRCWKPRSPRPIGTSANISP